jgi:hypothetical protein
MIVWSICAPTVNGTVTLRGLWKSSEFGAILWLISRRYDHERAGAKTARKAGKLAQAPQPRALAGRPLTGSLSGLSGHEIPA